MFTQLLFSSQPKPLNENYSQDLTPAPLSPQATHTQNNNNKYNVNTNQVWLQVKLFICHI